jgi:hypothetical protein
MHHLSLCLVHHDDPNYNKKRCCMLKCTTVDLSLAPPLLGLICSLLASAPRWRELRDEHCV